MNIRKLAVFPNLNKKNVCQALPEFIALCRNWNLEPILPCENATKFGCKGYDLNKTDSLSISDAAVSLGGDGTLLKMAHYVVPLGIPAFGINFGKLGFLAEIDFKSIEKAICKISQGSYFIETRSLLQASVLYQNKLLSKVHALNDLVLTKGLFSKLAHFTLSINGNLSGKYAADGIIVATATGSTAYSLSAGGPLVMPKLEISVITPVCAHSLAARTLVIPISEILDFKAIPGSEEMILAADGENIMEITNDYIVRIEKSPYVMKLIRLTRRDYYQTWQQKLMRNL